MRTTEEKHLHPLPCPVRENPGAKNPAIIMIYPKLYTLVRFCSCGPRSKAPVPTRTLVSQPHRHHSDGRGSVQCSVTVIVRSAHNPTGPSMWPPPKTGPRKGEEERSKKKTATMSEVARHMGSCNPARDLRRSSPISGAFLTTGHLGMAGMKLQ